MGKRAKRAMPETYLRARIESMGSPSGETAPTEIDPNSLLRGEDRKIGMRKISAVADWGMSVFFPKYGRVPTQIEETAAIDSGEIGRWIESHYQTKVLKREIVIKGQAVSFEAFTAKTVKVKDTKWQDENDAWEKVQREKRWTKQSQNAAIEAAVRGEIKGVEAMEAFAAKAYAIAENRWQIAQIMGR